MLREVCSSRSGAVASCLRSALGLAAVGALLAGCGGMGGGGGGGPSMGDRFSQLFGSGSPASSNAQLVGTPPKPFAGGNAPASGGAVQGAPFENCPGVAVREGASTLQVGTKGSTIADNNDLRYQGTIIRNARDCTVVGNGQVNARVGIQGRVIVGPAGAPASVELPLRVAVVQEGVQPKTVATKLYRTTVEIGAQENVPFSFVAEDVTFPIPPTEALDAYVIYIGFDPDGGRAAPQRKGRAAR